MSVLANITHTTSNSALQPWSHRQPFAIRILITIASGFAVGLIGTAAHRMGAAQNIPYGLVLAFALVIVSTWCARARSNAIGQGFHLLASSAAVWMLTGYGPGGDAMVPVGFSVAVPYFCEHAGVIWMLGVIVIQMIMLVLPSRWFVIPDRLVSGSAAKTVGVKAADTKSPAMKADRPATGGKTAINRGSDDGEGERP